MSSSNIIRVGGQELQQVIVLDTLRSWQPAKPDEGFRPVPLGGEDLPEPPEVEEEELPPPPPTMLEEEALRRIEEAREDGMKKGREQAQAELSTVSEALAQALAATGALRGKLMHEAEEDLLKLSLLIARKVLLREFSGGPAALAGLVRGAVDLASDGGEVVVKLSPEDYALVANCREFGELLSETRSVTLKGDPAVARAGCLVETVRGNIDAGMDAQLDEICRVLAEEKNAHREHAGD